MNLKVYNMLGQEVASLVAGDRSAGYHQEMWDATRYSSGMYVYQLVATDERGAKQIALLEDRICVSAACHMESANCNP